MSVALIFLSGIVINELSDKIELSGWVVVVAAIAVLLVMVGVQRHGDDERESVVSRALEGNLRDLAFIALLAMVIGFVVGALALLPIFETKVIRLPQGGLMHNYEIAAVVPIIALTCIAALNRRPVLLMATFVFSAVAGMTMAIVTLADEANDASRTYVGWLLAVAVPAVLLYYSNDLWRVMKELLLPTTTVRLGEKAAMPEPSVSGTGGEPNHTVQATADSDARGTPE
jgi:hypothetical protein